MSPTGTRDGDGTLSRPWDILSATDGTHRAKLAGGGTVWLTGGTYRLEPALNREGLGYRVATSGTATNPLIYRALPGQKVLIDGGLSLFGASYVWLWGLAVTVTDLVEGRAPFGLSGSWPPGAPNGGISLYNTVGCKVINCVLFRNRQGLNLWTEAADAEAYGCIIYDNGWVGSDRSHGHSIYVQSPPTTRKLIEDCIITATDYSRGWRDGRYTVHGYGERVAVAAITVRGMMQAGTRDAFLLDDGAPLGANEGHKLLDSVIYGVRVRLGSRPDQPLEIRGSTIVGDLQASTGPEVRRSGNLIVPPDGRPSNAQAILRPNRYEPNRAHLMLLDWQRRGRMVVDASGWIAAGERVKVLDPTDLWGTPVFSGAWPAGGVEFQVPDGARILVLVKDAAPGVVPAPGVPPPPPALTQAAAVAQRIEEADVTPALRRLP